MSDVVFQYLLKIDFDGEVRGYAQTTPQRVDGISFGVGLVDLSIPPREASLVGIGGGEGSLTFTLALEDTDVWALAKAGVRLQRSAVNLYAWLPGQTLDQATELYRGELRAPAFDFSAGLFSAGAAAPASTSDTAFPPALMKDEGRFTDLPEESLRLAVPVIYGTARGVPLIPLELDPGPFGFADFLVAGHPLVAQSISVAIDGQPVANYTVQNDGRDNFGSPYSYISVSGLFYSPDLYAVEVQGKPAPDGTAIDRLGDVLLDLWLSYGRGKFYDLDRQRVYGSRSLLNRYKVGFFINSRSEGQTVLDILASRFSQQFPVVFGPTNGKFGWDTAFVPPLTAEPVYNLIYGQNIHDRGEVVETDAGAVLNQFQVEYGYDGFQSESLGSLFFGENDGVCKGSVSRWGKSPVQSFNAADVPDAGTAYVLAEDSARRLALVRKQVTYSLGDPALLVLPLFSVVTVTDTLLGWAGEKFLIEGLLPRADGRVDIRLISLKGL